MTALEMLAHVLYSDLSEGLAPLYDLEGVRKDIDETNYYGVLLPQGLSLKLNMYELKSELDLLVALSPLKSEIDRLITYGFPVGVLVSLVDEFAPEDQLPVLTACIYLTDLDIAKHAAMCVGSSQVIGISLPFDTVVL